MGSCGREDKESLVTFYAVENEITNVDELRDRMLVAVVKLRLLISNKSIKRT